MIFQNCTKVYLIVLTKLYTPKFVTEGEGIYKQLSSAAFIIAFQICHYAYGYTKELSKQLQGSTIEIIRAYKLAHE